ncbi:MAG: hypothetical protein RL885_02085 [Planctomycetota bacterium]
MTARTRRQSGFALVSVIIVLAALAVIATPFAISMRNHAKTSAVTSASSRVRLGAEGARNHAVHVLSRLHPGADLDATPSADTAAELEVGDWGALAPLDVRNPRGDLWSARAEDEQAKANLNSVSPLLISNLLGGTILSGELTEEGAVVRVADTAAFPETGFVFVGGEVVEYSRKTGSSFEGCTRGRFSELAWFSSAIEHPDGTPVLPFKAWEAAAHRSRRESTRLTELTSIWSLREVPFAGGPSPQTWSLPEIERIEEDVTVYSKLLVGRGWIDPQVLLQPVEGGGVTGSILVANARYFGPGTTIRITDGQIVEHAIVTRSEPQGQLAYRLTLESPLSSGFDAEDTRVFALARHPVNINTASPRLLRALVYGLRSGAETGDVVDSGIAESFVTRVLAARDDGGLSSHQDLYQRVLRPAEDAGEMTNGHVRAIYTNAMHSGDMRIGMGTTGFCYESYGTYRVEASAVAHARSGLERGRHTIEQVVSAVPQTDLLQVWATQRDFEDLIVSSRASRYFLTGPTNQHRFEQGNVPPSRVPVHLGWQRFPSQDPNEGFLQLEPYRKWAPQNVFIEHFDNDDDPEGRDLSRNGYSVALGGGGGGGNGPAAWVDQFGVVPYGIDLWYRPDAGPGPVFDSGLNDIEGRLTLFIEGNDVVLQVADNVLDDPRTQWPEVAEARWSSPSPIEARTWYHLGGSWRGSRPSDITLTVDGIPRGDKRGLTQLTSTLSDLTSLAPPTPNPGGGAPPTQIIPPNASSMVEENISVESTRGFPPQGVVRIGNEIVEYNEISGNTLITARSRYFRGGRGARGTLAAARPHPAGSTVELYGYSTPISSPILPYNANLAGSLGLPDVGILSGGEPIEHPTTKAELGVGLTDASTALTMRSPLPGNPGDRTFMEAFSEDGGVALVVSSYAGFGFGTQNSPVLQVGGVDLIRYARADRGSATLSGIQRYGDIDRFKDTGEFVSGGAPAQAWAFLDEESWAPNGWRLRVNGQTVNVFGDGDYTAIIPLSIGIAGLTPETLLDPQQSGRGEERLQIGLDEETEWIRYNSVQVTDGWVTRNEAYLVDSVRVAIQSDSSLNSRGLADRVPPSEQGRTVEITPRTSLKADIFERLVQGRLRFRGQYGTTAGKHQDGALVLPVFRCWKTGRITGRPGRGDWVTTITPNGSKEGNVINWAWTDDDGSDPRDQFESYFAFVQVGVNLHVPTVRLDSQGQTQSLAQLDSREIVRIVKYPSGELPEQTGGQFFFGQRYDGGGGGPAFVDEVEFQRFEDPVVQRASSRYRLIQECFEDSRTIDVMADSVEINHWDGYGIRSITSRLFDGGGVVQIGDELIAYESVDPSTGQLQVASDGRGFLLSDPATHAVGERMVYLPQFRVTTLTQAMQATDDQLFVVDASRFPPSGMVLVGNEVIAYVRKPNNQLLQLASERIDQGGTGDDTRGLLRGRFGTAPTQADSGSTVYLLPFRYWDRYQRLSDHPELAYFQAYVSQKRAFWRALTWDEQIPEPQYMDVKTLARIGGKVPWNIEPGSTPYLFEFDEPIDGDSPNHMRVQGDDLELRMFVEYKVGAFVATTFLPNAWKKTPLIRMAAVDYIAPTFVESHVETR